MVTAGLTFTQWLQDSTVAHDALTPTQEGVLQAAFHFLEQRGRDYYSVRLLSHVLLHAGTGLKVAQIARLLGISRSAASAQQGLSSKEVVQAAHHRCAGRPHGKLLPRFAGPIAHFLHDQPQATRWDLLDFIQRTWSVSVSRVALNHFLHKYGLHSASRTEALPTVAAPSPEPPATAPAEAPTDTTDTTDTATRLETVYVPPAAGVPVPVPPPAFFFAPTHYAGAFLLLPKVLTWLDLAEDCFTDDYGSLCRGLLTSAFAPIIGLQRLFHLDQMEDRGFAILTGGLRCPSRQLVGGWRRHLPWYEVDAFCRRTAPWEWIRGEKALVSFDEHSIPRWTHKYAIRKGYVTIRNKYMRCEKLYYGYHTELERYLCVQATPGNVELRDVAVPLTQRVLRAGQPQHLHALFDAGAGKADLNVRALLQLTTVHPNLTVTLRACRHWHRMQRWQQLPSGLFVAYEEPGAWVGAPPKEIRLAETTTVLRGETAEQAVRTILCHEIVPGPKPDRWHTLFTSGTSEPEEVLDDFRKRQHHEQAYRVGVHDEDLNAAPCGYDKESPDCQHPRFQRGPLQMIGWLIALVYNAVGDLGVQLRERYHRAHVETLRRTFLNRPGKLYVTPEAVIVYLDPFKGQQELIPVIDEVNEEQCRVPWLENRRLVISLTPGSNPLQGGP